MIWKERAIVAALLAFGAILSFGIYQSEFGGEESVFSRYPFSLGLDLAGGTHLVYTADIAGLSGRDVNDALESLRDVIERRVNIFGVSEPVVQVEKNRVDDGIGRLIVELPGITDVEEAVTLIGATPVLEFYTEKNDISSGEELNENISLDEFYEPSGLSGGHLIRAAVLFSQVTGEAYVALTFNDEGEKLFAEITRENIGRTIAIYLDGLPISAPVVQQEITGGQAQITGNFSPEEAKILAGRLNQGALPVPISLLSTQTIGASLGDEALERGVRGGIWGLVLVSIFFIFWYRLPGFLAIISLTFYLAVMFSLFKIIPVTLTAAGIAGFILSMGIAVDANVLIFERLREEIQGDKSLPLAISEAFSRAWLSIRDANLSSLFTAVILFWFGTSLIKGFALTFGLGVLVSMFSAIIFTKALILSLGIKKAGFIMRSGFKTHI